jgi:hypothetical protein
MKFITGNNYKYLKRKWASIFSFRLMIYSFTVVEIQVWDDFTFHLEFLNFWIESR